MVLFCVHIDSLSSSDYFHPIPFDLIEQRFPSNNFWSDILGESEEPFFFYPVKCNFDEVAFLRLKVLSARLENRSNQLFEYGG